VSTTATLKPCFSHDKPPSMQPSWPTQTTSKTSASALSTANRRLDQPASKGQAVNPKYPTVHSKLLTLGVAKSLTRSGGLSALVYRKRRAWARCRVARFGLIRPVHRGNSMRISAHEASQNHSVLKIVISRSRRSASPALPRVSEISTISLASFRTNCLSTRDFTANASRTSRSANSMDSAH